nr:hypothetical protein [Brachybacterium faecium]
MRSGFVLGLGDDAASSLGAPVRSTRVIAVFAAISVVAAGVVGFVGPAGALGRSLIAPARIPAGLMASLLGAPCFVWLLWCSRA